MNQFIVSQLERWCFEACYPISYLRNHFYVNVSANTALVSPYFWVVIQTASKFIQHCQSQIVGWPSSSYLRHTLDTVLWLRHCDISNTLDSGLPCSVRVHRKSQGRICFLCPFFLVSQLSPNHFVNPLMSAKGLRPDPDFTTRFWVEHPLKLYKTIIICFITVRFPCKQTLQKATKGWNCHNVLHMSMKTTEYGQRLQSGVQGVPDFYKVCHVKRSQELVINEKVTVTVIVYPDKDPSKLERNSWYTIYLTINIRSVVRVQTLWTIGLLP